MGWSRVERGGWGRVEMGWGRVEMGWSRAGMVWGRAGMLQGRTGMVWRTGMCEEQGCVESRHGVG